MPRAVIGVGGGIAAYKICSVVRSLKEQHWDITVVPTRAAEKFVGRATWEALSGKPVTSEVFDHVSEVNHVRLGQQADLIIVAPATADLLAQAASGLASDLLGNVLLTARCPVLFVPAMHTEMWQHPATQDNVATLRRRGAIVLEPATGRLTGSDSGPGRLPEPWEIVASATAILEGGARPRDCQNLHVVITAGGTQEAIDPVRYLGNRSSGRQGVALAQAARDRGASVTLIAGDVDTDLPGGVTIRRISSAQELAEATRNEQHLADVVIMAAAVADYRPVNREEYKVKKDAGGLTSIALQENPDILANLVGERGPDARPYLVGFAAETGDESHSVIEHGRRKFRAKGCDMMVINQVGESRGFGTPDNQAVIVTTHDEIATPQVSKRVLADLIIDQILGHMNSEGHAPAPPATPDP